MTLGVKMAKMKNHLGQAALYNAYTLPQDHIRTYVHAYYSMWTRTRPRKPQSAVSKTAFRWQAITIRHYLYNVCTEWLMIIALVYLHCT